MKLSFAYLLVLAIIALAVSEAALTRERRSVNFTPSWGKRSTGMDLLRNPSKIFVGFFVVLKTPKLSFEIKWPLEEEETNIKQSQKKTHFAIYGQEKISFFKRERLLLASRASNVYFFVRPHMINIVVIAKHERILLCNTYLLTYLHISKLHIGQFNSLKKIYREMIYYNIIH